MSTLNDLVVLRASDGVLIPVLKSILYFASPFFSDLFSIPQPKDSDTTNDPIDISEPSTTIELIINICQNAYFPLNQVSLSDIASLLQAADKYNIKVVQDNALSSLTRPKFLEKEPLRVYVIASRYGAHDTAALAVQHILRYPLLHADYFPELEMVDGGTIYRVLHYQKRCMAAAIDIATDHTWIREGSYVFIGCPEANSYDEEGNQDPNTRMTTIRTVSSRKHKNGYTKTVYVHPWWTEFMATTKVAFSESIHPEVIRDKSRVKEALSSAPECSHCRRRVGSDFINFLEAFENELQTRIDEVSVLLLKIQILL